MDDAVVYIVEDDGEQLAALQEMVAAAFPHVAGFTSAAAFLQAYANDRPGCLLLDVAMPDMNGFELHRKLQFDGVLLPIVYLTAHGNVQMAVDAIQHGAINFLEKPVREQDLWASLRKGIELDEQNRRELARKAEIEANLAQLTPGERKVLEQILGGSSNKEIAQELHLSVRTIEDRRSRLMKKMGARSLAELVQMITAVRQAGS